MKVDTGESLRWRHLHAAHVDETDGTILHWVADQHGGQAKGISKNTFFCQAYTAWLQYVNNEENEQFLQLRLQAYVYPIQAPIAFPTDNEKASPAILYIKCRFCISRNSDAFCNTQHSFS